MVIIRIGDQCPKCQKGTMRATYDAYESRCNACGFWWDGWAQKEVDPFEDYLLEEEDDDE